MLVLAEVGREVVTPTLCLTRVSAYKRFSE